MLPQKKVTIAIPTFRRPDGIQMALNSIEAVQIPAELSANVLVVDNDAQASAKPIVEDFSHRSRFDVFYVVEPKRGLSNVRNRILAEAINLDADYLAGVDDDEVVSPDWLVCLWNGLNEYEAACAGGSQQFIFPENAPDWMKHVRVFNPYANRQTGKIVNDISSGNYLLDLAFIRKHSLKFSCRYNVVGGGDSDFFVRCAKHGARIVWIKEAIVKETVPGHRATLKWIIRRHYRIGYGMTCVQEKSKPILFLNSLLKTACYPLLCIISFAILRKQAGFKFFFNYFFQMGKLCACIGVRPYKEYKH